MEILGVGVFIIGIILSFVGGVGFIIATFRAGILWGLACMFLPFVSLIFLFVHWKLAEKPFYLSLLGCALVFGGAVLIPETA